MDQNQQHILLIPNPSVGTPVFSLGATSSRCKAGDYVTYAANASDATSLLYSLDAASITGGNSIDASTGEVAYNSGWTGTSIITATANGCNGPVSATHTVTIYDNVANPVFTLGATSTRCQGATAETYAATAANSTGILYSLDAASITGGNSINSSTGEVTYIAGWSGTSTITASASGCYGPATSVHMVTITSTVGTPVFTIGANSTRCQGAGSVTYSASASNSTSIAYSLDAASITGGNSINTSTGSVTYAIGWSGTSTITASAAGCNGPITSGHIVTITPTVGTPIFTIGTTSTRCQGATAETYAANASNSTGITYTLDAASLSAGNSIDASTGAVTYIAGWNSTTTITASANGCNGPATSTHSVTIGSPVESPVFAMGTNSSRCKAGGTITYAATAANSTGITYSLDAVSLAAGLLINSSTGMVTYFGYWTGTSIITATATGCSGPVSSSHTAVTNSDPVFDGGATSVRCQGGGTVNYPASSSVSLTYSLDAASLSGGNTINSSTGEVTYSAAWNGTTTVIVTPSGCGSASSVSHVVTINPTVGNPVFSMGATSVRCLGAGNVTYGATATNNTGITYSLDAASVAGGNTINATTGNLNYDAGWSGTTTITATADGCNGPVSTDHTVTINPAVGTSSFTLGANSTRCEKGETVVYTANATNTTGITYSLDATSLAGGNSINSANGAVTYQNNYVGTSIITATAAGCNGPQTASHTVTSFDNVEDPIFDIGSNSTRCQGAGNATYTATALYSNSIVYSLDANSLAAGNTINATTGEVTYVAGWSGTTKIKATASGVCGNPKEKEHDVTVTPSVGAPAFDFGPSSTRCQKGETIDYKANAANKTGISFSLDAASLAAGNTISADPTEGKVTFTAGWVGTSVVTVTVYGCNGPLSTTHTITTNGTVAAPLFTIGASSTRCQGVEVINYSATAASNTGITYSLNGAAITAGNTINASTGDVTYVAGWTGSTTITATATGCSGPKTATHTVTITPTVGTPVFSLGATTTRCQSAGTVNYNATASNSTSIAYSLDASSLSGGNSINTSTGTVTYVAGWTGSSSIIATAQGCNGPKTAMHTVTITPIVGTPVFTLGASSVRCLGSGSVTYTATSSNSTGITYSLDGTSRAFGNSINSTTGTVTYSALWVGTSTITATAAGCSGPANGNTYS